MNDPARTMALSSRFKKASLYTFIVFLAISALLAIVIVLGGDFGSFEFNVLITTTVVAAASICALCCSAYAQRSGIIWPGIAGAVLACVAAVLIILGAWIEIGSEDYWHITITAGIFAIAAAHTLALLGLRLNPNHRWLKPVTAVTIFSLAAIVSSFITSSAFDDDATWKVMIVLAIIVVLETLVIPLLTRLASTETEPEPDRQTLVLNRKAGGIYADEQGRLYEIKPMAPSNASTSDGISSREHD